MSAIFRFGIMFIMPLDRIEREIAIRYGYVKVRCFCDKFVAKKGSSECAVCKHNETLACCLCEKCKWFYPDDPG